MTDKHDTFQQPHPTCPHCGYMMDTDDMYSLTVGEDLFALAPDEGQTCVNCPRCDAEYWVKGGYMPHYTSAFSEEEL